MSQVDVLCIQGWIYISRHSFLIHISVFILFYVDSLFFLLAQLTKTQKKKTQKENMIARMAKERGKIDSDHYFFIYCNL